MISVSYLIFFYHIDAELVHFTVDCIDIMLHWPMKKQLSQYSRLLTLITCIRSLSSLHTFPPELNNHLDIQYQHILSLQPFIQDTLSRSFTLIEDESNKNDSSGESESKSSESGDDESSNSESSGNDENDENDIHESHILESSRRKSSHCGWSLVVFVMSVLLMGITLIPVSSYTCNHIDVILPYSNMTEYLQGYCREYERGIAVLENQRVTIT